MPQFGILGPLEVVHAGRRLALGGSKQRRLLAVLLVHLGTVVSADRLVEAVWDGAAPASAAGTLRTHLSHLRRSLAEAGAGDLLVTRAPGYALDLAPERLDARRFERLVEAGRAALARGDAEPATEALREALGLWRGPVLADLDRPRFAEAETARLDELFVVALEARVDADLALGRHRELVAELEALVDAHPFRERLCGQLMLALYRSGRQADALAVYRAARQRLDEELGLAPGPALADLETAILRHDPALAAPTAQSETARVPDRPPRRSPPDALLDVVRRTPMVGRSGELERLCALWEATRQGGRRVGLVSGEAGVGKTRLLAEFAAVATDEEALLLVGHCDEALLIPYQPVAEALRSNPEATRVLASAPQAVSDRLAPLVDGAASARSDDPAARADAESGRYALFDAVGRLLALLAHTAPVVLVVEEAERIDRASSLLLRHLVRHLPEGVLLLVCYRDPPGSRHAPLAELLGEVAGRGLADRLALEPLTERDLAALAAALTGEEATPAFLRRLWTYTGGNPFYATAVIRDLGPIATGAAWPVPTGVRDVLRGRLRALPQTSQQVLACAAVLGRDAEFALLQAVADQPEDDAVDAVEHALRAGVLVESGSSWAASYAFPHDLVREAVYADIPAPRRQRLHLRAAQALEAAGLRRPGEVAAAALHLRAAGALADPSQAAELSLRAADAAGDLYAWDEAVAHAEAAVAILERAGAPPAQQAQAAVRAAGLLVKSSLDYGRAVRHLEAALEHLAGDEAAAAKVRVRLGAVLATHSSVMDIPRALEEFAAAEPLLGDGPAAYRLQQGKAQAALFGLRTDEGLAAAECALDLAERLGSRRLSVWPRWGLAWHRFNRGDLAAAWALLDEAFATAQELGDPVLGWGSANAAGLVGNAYLLDPTAAEDWCRRGLAQPRLDTLTHPHGGVLDQLVLALAITGRTAAARDAAAALPPDAVSRRMLTLLAGDWEGAERAWASALDHDLAAGDRLDATLNAFWLAQARLLLGRAGEAQAALQQALALSVGGPQVPAELMVRAELVRLRAGDGDADEAAAHLARCDAILAGGEDWRGQSGNVELARAAFAAARGQHADADAAHARALEAFTAYGLPWRRAEALLAWARALAAAGQTGDASANVTAADEVYGELEAAERWRSRAVREFLT